MKYSRDAEEMGEGLGLGPPKPQEGSRSRCQWKLVVLTVWEGGFESKVSLTASERSVSKTQSRRLKGGPGTRRGISHV